jgi:hypothetical protein
VCGSQFLASALFLLARFPHGGSILFKELENLIRESLENQQRISPKRRESLLRDSPLREEGPDLEGDVIQLARAGHLEGAERVLEPDGQPLYKLEVEPAHAPAVDSDDLVADLRGCAGAVKCLHL